MTKGTNIDKVIQDAVQEYDALSVQIEDLRTRQKEITADLKSETGISVAVFKEARKWRDMESDTRAEHADDLKICLKAMGVGVQLEMFPDAPNPDEVAKAEAA